MDAVDQTVTLDGRRHAPPRNERSYVLVITPESSTMYFVPDDGIVVIGRGQDADLRVDHSSVSRRHAQLLLEHGAIRVSDLDSYNGTRVNGEPVSATRTVVTGDVITVGEVELVVHAAPRANASSDVMDETTWRRRLDEELERALAYQRPLSVLAIAGAAPDTAAARLRTIDIVGRGDDGDVVAILPEADGEAAYALATALGARVGIASCPTDALDGASLVLAARTAVARAKPIATAADTVEVRDLGTRTVLVGHPATVRVYDLLKRLAAVSLPVLVIGETGVGKENAAFAVHHASARRDRPFIALNCAALPEQLLEAELFGYERGAFTGATQSKPGQLEQAGGGTLFLDEVGEMAPAAQAKFLRVLQEREFQRLGGTRVLRTDARVVAATNRDLQQAMRQGQFREDLFYRLNVFAIRLPPLRDRRDDVMPLSEAFLVEYGRSLGRPPAGISRDARKRLMEYHWPGNVRELRNILERAAILCDGGLITAEHLALGPAAAARPSPAPAPREEERVAEAAPVQADPPVSGDLQSMERGMIEQALQNARFNKSKAAQALGLTRAQLYVRMRRYGLE